MYAHTYFAVHFYLIIAYIYCTEGSRRVLTLTHSFEYNVLFLDAIIFFQ